MAKIKVRPLDLADVERIVGKSPTLKNYEKKLLADMEAKQEEAINKLKEDYDRGWFGTEDSEGGLESWLPDSANDPTDFFGNLDRSGWADSLCSHHCGADCYKPSLWQRFKRWFTWHR